MKEEVHRRAAAGIKLLIYRCGDRRWLEEKNILGNPNV